MSNSIKARLKLVGCMSYGMENENFMLPIFGKSSLLDFFAIQCVDELSGLVDGFKTVELDRSKLRAVSSKIEVGTGDDPIYVFLDDQREMHVGRLADLKITFMQYEAKNPHNAGTILQIKELVGSQDDKRFARKRIRNRMFDNGSALVAKNFLEGSILRIELWSILLKAAPSRESALRILEARPKLSAKINENNRVSVDLSAVSPEDYGFLDISNITKDLQNEIDGTVRSDLQIEENLFTQGVFTAEEIDQHVSRARALGRQEERVAVILSYLIDDFDLGKEIIKSYKKDRSAFASDAVKLISSTMIDNRPDNYSNEALVEMLISRLYKRCFPMNRGALLYYLAKHLSGNKLLSEALRDLWENSGAVFVHQWDREIAEHLDSVDGPKSDKQVDLFGNMT